MLVGIGHIELFIPASGSLKSKRFVMKSLKTKLRNKFNLSVSEVGETEKWQRATIGISIVANQRKLVDHSLQQVLSFVDNFDGVEVMHHHFEIV